MNIYQKLSVILGLSLFLPLAWQVLRGKAEQSLATMVLWGSMDCIAAVSIYLQGGNYQLSAAYTVGSIIVILCILHANMFDWGWFETFMAGLVGVCLIGWYFSGSYLATILSTTALVLASTPMLRDSWLKPEKFPTLTYVGFSTANLFGTLGGLDWSVKERLYPFSALAVCVVMVLASLRKVQDHSRSIRC